MYTGLHAPAQMQVGTAHFTATMQCTATIALPISLQQSNCKMCCKSVAQTTEISHVGAHPRPYPIFLGIFMGSSLLTINQR